MRRSISFITACFLSLLVVQVSFAQEGPNYRKQLRKVFRQLDSTQRAELLAFAQSLYLADSTSTETPDVGSEAANPYKEVEVVTIEESPIIESPSSHTLELGNNSLSLGGVPELPSIPTKPEDPMEQLAKMPKSSIQWSAKAFNFEEISQGDTVSHTFHFTNTGTHPLLIGRVKPSCGCTTPAYSEEEIAPGEKGFVKVLFDSKDKLGPQTKTVTVFLNNQEGPQVLRFKGEVIKPKG